MSFSLRPKPNPALRPRWHYKTYLPQHFGPVGTRNLMPNPIDFQNVVLSAARAYPSTWSLLALET